MNELHLYSLLILLLFFSATYSSTAQTRMGTTDGHIHASANTEDDITNTNETRYFHGFLLGLPKDIHLQGVFYIQQGIVYSQNGCRQEENWFSGYEKPQEYGGNVLAGYGSWGAVTICAIGQYEVNL